MLFFNDIYGQQRKLLAILAIFYISRYCSILLRLNTADECFRYHLLYTQIKAVKLMPTQVTACVYSVPTPVRTNLRQGRSRAYLACHDARTGLTDHTILLDTSLNNLRPFDRVKADDDGTCTSTSSFGLLATGHRTVGGVG